MPIDDRLREGLPLALDELLPDDVEQGLALTLQRVERRRGLRRGGYALALVAATAVVAAVAIRGDDEPRSLEPVAPPAGQVRVLDPEVGSAAEPAPLEPDAYAIGFLGASDDAPWAEIEVPAGWGHDRLHPATGPDLDPHLRRIELSGVAMVAPDPCEQSFVPVGPEVADLMTSLAAQQTVEPARPRSVRIDGHVGQVLQVHVPLDVDVAGCDDGSLVPWMNPGGSHPTVFPGWTYRVWAVDVDGERLVVLAAHGPDATPAERTELSTMVETLRFVDAPTS
ncbi:MAG: hypothetical protein ABW035_15125 [Acidimicrobiales bacterium]